MTNRYRCKVLTLGQQQHNNCLWPFVWDYPGEPVPEETFTHSHLS